MFIIPRYGLTDQHSHTAEGWQISSRFVFVNARGIEKAGEGEKKKGHGLLQGHATLIDR